jgi:2,5-diamino-6-(ribosylamino)-4(3H)-pyrimidinone 5'-phosphate reductase
MAESSKPRDTLYFSEENKKPFQEYLPHHALPTSRAFCTLTYASSLDSQISLAPGVQTPLSGPETKAMTHFLRSQHDGILVGAGTAKADDPSLNCRLDGTGGYGLPGLASQPRPIILDPHGQWPFEKSKVWRLAKEEKGRAPFVLTGVPKMPDQRVELIESLRGKYVHVPLYAAPYSGLEPRMRWSVILETLMQLGVESVMVEGGGMVINTLLESENQQFVDSMIITIAPTWLGEGGVMVSPKEKREEGTKAPVGRLKNTKWIQMGDDVVLIGRFR